jgi:hypothetical protein
MDKEELLGRYEVFGDEGVYSEAMGVSRMPWRVWYHLGWLGGSPALRR